MFLQVSMIFFLLFVTPHDATANEYFIDVYEEVDDFLQLSEKYDKAPRDSFISILSETKAEINQEMNIFLDDVLLLLANNQVVDLKKNIESLTKKNKNISEEIAKLLITQQGAETNKKFYEIWKKTQDDITKNIAQLRQEKEENNITITANRQKIIFFLQQNGVNLSQEEAESLLKTVTGNDFVDTIAVLKSVHNIIASLQQTLKTEDENIHIARKYYGLFWLSTKAYYRQLQRFIEHIDAKYLPKLEAIQAENTLLIQKTKKLVKTNKTYQSNLDAQLLTNEAIGIYRTMLRQQKGRIQHQQKQINQILLHAENTYKTVNLAHSLYQSMDENLSAYNALMSLPAIEMTPFRNSQLELKMLELTEQINQ